MCHIQTTDLATAFTLHFIRCHAAGMQRAGRFIPRQPGMNHHSTHVEEGSPACRPNQRKVVDLVENWVGSETNVKERANEGFQTQTKNVRVPLETAPRCCEHTNHHLDPHSNINGSNCRSSVKLLGILFDQEYAVDVGDRFLHNCHVRL